jgi:hypothetical protein
VPTLNSLILCLFSLNLAAGVLQSQLLQESLLDSSHNSLEISIFPSKLAYQAGTPIELSVKIENRSPNRLLVGRTLGTLPDAPFRIAFTIQDESVTVLRQAEDDPAELPCLDLSEHQGKSLRWWIILEPHGSITKTVVVPRELAPATLKPGKYRIRATYRSVGMLTGGHCGASAPNSAGAPSTIEPWKGQVETNATWIQITPAPASKANGEKIKEPTR